MALRQPLQPDHNNFSRLSRATCLIIRACTHTFFNTKAKRHSWGVCSRLRSRPRSLRLFSSPAFLFCLLHCSPTASFAITVAIPVSPLVGYSIDLLPPSPLNPTISTRFYIRIVSITSCLRVLSIAASTARPSVTVSFVFGVVFLRRPMTLDP